MDRVMIFLSWSELLPIGGYEFASRALRSYRWGLGLGLFHRTGDGWVASTACRSDSRRRCVRPPLSSAPGRFMFQPLQVALEGRRGDVESHATQALRHLLQGVS